MSDEKSNGHAPPAAPIGHEPEEAAVGITLRDAFAAQCAGGLISGIGDPLVAMHEAQNIARTAYRLADAMLAERAGRGRTETEEEPAEMGAET
jgi:hypothetical protein